MKRRAVQIVVLLILGAIVNVAVAWGLALTNFPSGKPNLIEQGASNTLQQALGNKVKVGLAFQHEPRTWAVDRLIVVGYVYGLTQNETCSLVRLTSGVPLRSMSGTQLAIKDDYWGEFAIIMANPIANQAGLDNSKILPLQCIWPGFAINTIFYAAILWVAWFTPGMVRRRIRRRRGLCPACAYPIGSSPVCTECGVSINGKINLRGCSGVGENATT